MKRLKKLLAAVFACSLVLSAMPVNAAQDTSGLADGTAYLNINNADWDEFEAEWTNAEITGDGSYTVSMNAAEPQSLAQFNALEVVNGESVLGTGCVLTVDSIKINGEEIEMQGPSYTCSADGGGVTTRVNIYNEWNAPDETATAGDDKHVDHRIAEGNLMDATACLFSSDYLTDFQSIEVNFTVSGYGTQAAEGSASAPIEVEGPAMAHLNINNEAWEEFDAEYVDVEITGDGSYTVSMNAAEAQNLAQFNALEVENGEILLGTACVLTVDSIKINGEEIEMQGPSYTCSADGGGLTTRVNIYNEWNAPDETATAGDDNHIDNRVAEGSVMDATACLFSSDYLTGFQSIEVNFTVTGFGTQAAGSDAPEEEAPAASVDFGGTYNAYIGFQTPKYSFRNAWDDGSYGRDVDGDMDYFHQVTGWDGNDAVVLPGTFTDAVIAGNGTYTVSVDGLSFPDGEFADQEYMNLIFLSTDIPNTGEITISDVQLKVNGSSVDLMNGPIISPDSELYLNMLLQNIWNDEVGEIGYYAVPPTSMSITFTVSGFNYDAEAQAEEPTEAPAPADGNDAAPAEETASTDTEKGGSNVVVIVVIVVVVVVAAAGAGIVVAKKKKK
ncbi:MAG: hypothetical protein K2I07_09260 [Lachnospiraceae bacterium]|nr:hypothetical protein [Lachnospiraceae bacterium]